MSLRGLMIVTALSVVSLAAGAQEPATPAAARAQLADDAQKSAPPLAATPVADPDERVCHREPQMGSLLTRRVCTTRREREAQAARSKATLDQFQDHPLAQCGGSGCN